jgi:hypothetical protein
LNRVYINPFGQQPFDSNTMGQRTHYLTPAARQFIVEYAGDYFIQDADGRILGLGPDGITDFYRDVLNRRAIRFYGFPRDVDGDGDIELFQESTNPNADYGSAPVTGDVSVPNNPFTSPDVVPLKDHLRYASGDADTPVVFPHEKIVPRPDGGNYNASTLVPQLLEYGTQRTGTASNTPRPRDGIYLTAWGPDELDGNFPAPFDFPLGPQLIRIIIEVGDPDGSLDQPVVTELVFRVPD